MWKRFSVIVPIWVLICYLILYSSIGSSKMDFAYLKKISMLFPQGWGFFTKNPHDFMIDCYEVHNDELKLLTYKNFSTENIFGVSRKSRFVGYELSVVLSSAALLDWRKFTGEINYSNINACKTDTITFQSELLVFKRNRTYVAHKYKQVPFDWVGQGQEKYRPYELVKFTIK